ncbi:MAG TPA: hypothetical protein VGN26_12370 [Armatimonadota bacterium]|jgi:hypothetical protein
MKLSKKWTLGLLTIAASFLAALSHGVSLKEAGAAAVLTAVTLIHGQSKIDAAKVATGEYQK